MDEGFDKKLQLYKLLKEKTLRACRDDSFLFTDYIFGFKSVTMHKSWHDFMNAANHGIMLANRDSGKSQHMIGRILWEIGKNPNIRIKIATETDELAGKTMTAVSNTILRNERYKEVFPNAIPDTGHWSKFTITVQRDAVHLRDPTVEGAGMMTAVTGARADLVMFDDICGMRNTLYFPRLREQVKESFYSNWMNFLDGPEARWYLIGTPWHVEDLIGELRNNDNIPKAKEWWVGDNFESPWPERFSSEYFKGRLLLLKAKHYNRAYRGLAVSDQDSWINAGAVESCKDMTLKAYDVIQNKEFPKFTGVDLSHREGPKACPTVIFTMARTPNGKRIPCDIRILNDSNSLEIARAIIHVYEELKPTMITVENNNAQQYLVDTIKSLGPVGIPVQGYHTGQQKADVNVGVPSLLAEIETGQWVIPLGAGGNHDETCRCSFCIWVNEIKNYPYGSTDTVMASWLGLEGLRKIMEKRKPGGNFTVWNF